jgi:hypothetical protein
MSPSRPNAGRADDPHEPPDPDVAGWKVALFWVVALVLLWGLFYAVVTRILG